MEFVMECDNFSTLHIKTRNTCLYAHTSISTRQTFTFVNPLFFGTYIAHNKSNKQKIDMHRQRISMNKENKKNCSRTSTIECDKSRRMIIAGTSRCNEPSPKCCSDIDDTNDDFTIPVVASTHLNTTTNNNDIQSKKCIHIRHEQQQQQHYVQNTSSTTGEKQDTQFFSFSSTRSQSSQKHQYQQQSRASLFSTIRQRLKSSIILQNSVVYIDFLTFNDDIYIDHNYLFNHYQDDDLYNINTIVVDTTNFDVEANYLEQSSDQFDDDSIYRNNDDTTVRHGKSPRSVKDLDNYLLERSWRNDHKSKVCKKKKQVHFSNCCIILEIPNHSTYTIDELNNMYTCRDHINVLAQKNLFEIQYEYELQKSLSPPATTTTTTKTIQIQKYMDEDEYYCYEIDNKKVYLHPAHMPQQQCYHYYNDNKEDTTTGYSSSFVSTTTSPVYLYPEEQKVRLRLIATTLLEELMFNDSYL